MKIPNRDLTYCGNKECPSASKCFRFIGHYEFEDYIWMNDYQPDETGKCESYEELEGV